MMRYWDENWWCGPGSYFHGPFAMFINLAFWVGLALLLAMLFRVIHLVRENPM
jgi:putative membrane protein